MFNDGKDDVKYKRRSRLNIIAEILDAALEGAVKTRIMYQVSVNFVQFNEYVKFLLKAKLLNVARKKRRTIYKTTGKGRLLLRRFKEAEKMLCRPVSDEEAKPLIAKRGPVVYLLRK